LFALKVQLLAEKEYVLHIIADSCPLLTIPDNGGIYCYEIQGFHSVFGDNCFFTCNKGYELNGTSVVNCQSDGTWNDTVPTCEIGKNVISF